MRVCSVYFLLNSLDVCLRYDSTDVINDGIVLKTYHYSCFLSIYFLFLSLDGNKAHSLYYVLRAAGYKVKMPSLFFSLFIAGEPRSPDDYHQSS